MAFEKICTLDDVWEGEMNGFTAADGTALVSDRRGNLRRRADAAVGQDAAGDLENTAHAEPPFGTTVCGAAPEVHRT